MQVNDGSGFYTTSGLIDSIIVELNDTEVRGIENLAHIISCIQKLSSIRSAVIKMEKEREEVEADDVEDKSGSDL